MLGADVVVPEAQCLAQRKLQDLLGARRERDLTGGDLLARPDDPHNLGTYALDGDVEALEDPRSEAFFLTEKAEQNVLGPDVVVLERSRLLLRENDHLPGSLCKSLEHAAWSFPAGAGPLASGGAWSGCKALCVADRITRPDHPFGTAGEMDECSGAEGGHAAVYQRA